MHEITSEKAIKLLNKQIEDIPLLQQERRTTGDSQGFEIWKRNAKIAISKIFGATSEHKKDFEAINYNLRFFTNHTPQSKFDEAFCRGLDNAQSMLSSMIEEINEYGLESDVIEWMDDPIKIVELICHKFHIVARQLQERHEDRPTVEINDEYDVQDLFYALLRIHFDDVRPEEYTPSYAGASARMDFLLKQENIIIEIKKTRKSLKTKEIADQLIIDIAHYQSHPDCKILICFVYDPEGRIANPTGVENDLDKVTTAIKVKTIITPK